MQLYMIDGISNVLLIFAHKSATEYPKHLYELMNIEEFRNICLSFPFAQENSPWADHKYDHLVTFTVASKWFCILDIENKFCNIKCDPNQIDTLLEKYNGAMPAWHMNKRHWIKIVLESDIPDKEIASLISQAYNLIVNKLPKSTITKMTI